MEPKQRVFEDYEAKREAVPLLIGLVGPSGSGKTYSALRLATGIQRITGGDIHVIDTEARRSAHYADDFRFRITPFSAPFGPLDYLSAIEQCVRRGAKIVVTDSMSHEHEGPGGVLEMHDAEVQRLSRGDDSKAERVKLLAWQRPKAERRRLINTILQLPICTIFCFRAKEKLKIERGKDPTPLGFMPIAGDEFVYEMTLNCLLLPGSDGVPAWQSNQLGERATMKLPAQFRGLFNERAQLSEEIGATLARWARGGDAADMPPEVAQYVDRLAAIGATGTPGDLAAVQAELGQRFPKGSSHYSRMAAAFKAAQSAVAARARSGAATREPGSDG